MDNTVQVGKRRGFRGWRPMLGLLALVWFAGRLAAGDEATREWVVDGVTREARICWPKAGTARPGPVIFAFHGHGGNTRHAARTFGLQDLWPEATVVYPQGLDTPTPLVDPRGRRSGWQLAAGDQGDRDLAFFDAMLASLEKEHRVDPARVYAMGHSNGAAFTYLLWSARPEAFAAFAPVAGLLGAHAATPVAPRPVLHIAGRADNIVKFDWQERSIAMARRVNHCGAGRPWPPDATATEYPSSAGAPVVTWIHDGGHRFPDEAPVLIVKFFREHPRPGAKGATGG